MQRDDESPFENNMLEGRIVIDAWLVLHSPLAPEQFLDAELAKVKQIMLNKFYERFPGQRPIGDDNAEG